MDVHLLADECDLFEDALWRLRTPAFPASTNPPHRVVESPCQRAIELPPRNCARLKGALKRTVMVIMMALYYNAGPSEVWVCAQTGAIQFFDKNLAPLGKSTLCPRFPKRIKLR